MMVVASSSTSLDEVRVEDCSVDSDEEILEEDQLDFNFTDEEYLLEELRHSVQVSLPEGPTLHQKVVYETLSKFCNLCHVLGHSRLLCPKAATNTNKVQGQPSHDQLIPLASRVDTVPIADNVVLEVWVSVESRRKASKQSCCNPKGKEVIIAEPVSTVNTCETPSCPICAREVRNTSPSRIELLVANPYAGEVQRTDLLVAHTGDSVPARDFKSLPLLGMPTKSGVRTCSQKQRSRSGRVSPSPALP
ncbi:hypothetical protein Peur_004637 [Populus x canadensis]